MITKIIKLKWSNYIIYSIFLFFSAICFITPALFSGYPILTPDSTAYIDCGMDAYMNAVRPIGYSIIVRLFSFKFSLWLVIIAQSVLLSMVLYRFIDLFLPNWVGVLNSLQFYFWWFLLV